MNEVGGQSDGQSESHTWKIFNCSVCAGMSDAEEGDESLSSRASRAEHARFVLTCYKARKEWTSRRRRSKK